MGGAPLIVIRILPQLLLLGLVGVLQVLMLWHVIPSQSYILSALQQFFSHQGLAAVALFSFIENIVGVNVYFPGSVVLLVAMSTTAGNLEHAVVMYFAIYVPAMFGNISSYLLGRVGLAIGARKHRTLARRSSWGWWTTFVLTYWHPQLAAVTAVSAGIEGLRIPRYLGLLFATTVPWSLLWAYVIYQVGGAIMVRTDYNLLFVVYILGWIAWDVLRERRRSKSTEIS